LNNAVRTNNIDTRTSVSLLTGLLFGALAGFGTMLLLAPQSGSKTRAQIGQESIKMRDRATDTYDDLLTLSRFDNRKVLTGEHIDILTTDGFIRSAHV
jgi:gas vesicle protein